MAQSSKIEWCTATWNPIVGCSPVSPGCTNCYAMGQAHRLAGNPATPHYKGTTQVINGQRVWTGKVAPAPERILTAPLRWKKPQRIFVNSMGDLFHPAVPFSWISHTWAIMQVSSA